MSGLTFTDLSVGDDVWYIDNDGVSIIRVKVIILDAKKHQVHLFKSFLNDCKLDLVVGENEVGSSDAKAPLPDKFVYRLFRSFEDAQEYRAIVWYQHQNFLYGRYMRGETPEEKLIDIASVLDLTEGNTLHLVSLYTSEITKVHAMGNYNAKDDLVLLRYDDTRDPQQIDVRTTAEALGLRKFDGLIPAMPPLLHKNRYSAMEYQPLVHIYSKRLRVAGDPGCMLRRYPE